MVTSTTNGWGKAQLRPIYNGCPRTCGGPTKLNYGY